MMDQKKEFGTHEKIIEMTKVKDYGQGKRN